MQIEQLPKRAAKSRRGARIALPAVLALGLALGVGGAVAAPVDWTLENLTFTDGASATGTFEINTYGYLAPNWSITTGNGVIPGWTYGPSINAIIGGGDTVIDFYRTGYDGYLQLAFVNPLTAGPTDPLSYANSYECLGFQSLQGTCNSTERLFGNSVTGLATTDDPGFPVPEPLSLGILGAGLAVLGFRRLRRSRSA